MVHCPWRYNVEGWEEEDYWMSYTDLHSHLEDPHGRGTLHRRWPWMHSDASPYTLVHAGSPTHDNGDKQGGSGSGKLGAQAWWLVLHYSLLDTMVQTLGDAVIERTTKKPVKQDNFVT